MIILTTHLDTMNLVKLPQFSVLILINIKEYYLTYYLYFFCFFWAAGLSSCFTIHCNAVVYRQAAHQLITLMQVSRPKVEKPALPEELRRQQCCRVRDG